MPPQDLIMSTILNVDSDQVSTTSCFDAIIFKTFHIYIYIFFFFFFFKIEKLQANLI